MSPETQTNQNGTTMNINTKNWRIRWDAGIGYTVERLSDRDTRPVAIPNGHPNATAIAYMPLPAFERLCASAHATGERGIIGEDCPTCHSSRGIT